MAMSHRAHTFGGLWSSHALPVNQSAEKIIFVDNPDATVTAIIQVKYAGPSRKFVWVIPMPGHPTVGFSSNTVFQRLDAATAPQYWVEVSLEGTCKQQEIPDAAVDAGSGTYDKYGAPSAVDPTDAPVVMIDQGSVGPYDFVNVRIDPKLSDPAKVATDWFTTNGYDVTSVDSKVLGPYLREGLNLLAFKLTKGTDVGAIRPVILTYESKLPIIPIKPTSVAAQNDMGIQVWVIGPSQAVPDNYKSLVINDARIDWLSGAKFVAGTLPTGGVGPFGSEVEKPRNYDAVVTAAANEAGGQGFVTELGGPASQYRDKVWSSLDDQRFEAMSSQHYADGVDAIAAAKAAFGGWDGWKDAIEGATTIPAGVTIDELIRNPDRYRSAAKVDTTKFFRLLHEKVLKPVADTAALLYRAPYLTRLYSTMSSHEMTVDPAFNYNFDLAQISNVHVAKQTIQCSPALHQHDAPWRMKLPEGGELVGKGSGWPVADGSMPANLKIVTLSTSGSGTVVKDNSHDIGLQLEMPHVQSDVPGDSPKSSGAGKRCSVSHVGAGTGSAFALWMPLLGVFLALRRRLPRFFLLFLSGCGRRGGAPTQSDAGASAVPGAMTREQLRDPESCAGCHPNHYREWSSSMHAYAARDPVFLAMNRRGQRETHGKLGDFCIKCHAPMAVVDKRTKDGLDLERLPDKERGVSCYFCHNVTAVEGDHDAMLHLANDTTMRGPIKDPRPPAYAHRAEFSEMFEDTSPKSTALCGGCHDIVTPTGVHLKRTFEEYRNGLFSKSATGAPPSFDSCVGCHMPGHQAFAASLPGLALRTVHEHLWPAVDLPLTDFPHNDALRSAVEDCQLAKSVSFFTLKVTPPDLFTFQLKTNAGHNQPSGAAQDRRMWLEVLAYDGNGKLLDQVSSGNIADGGIEDKPEGDPKKDPHLLMFRDRIYDGESKPVHMFWQAARSSSHPDGYDSTVLPAASTTYVEGKHAVMKQYRLRGPAGLPARVTARLRVRPIGLDVLQDLVDSGDLDPAFVAGMSTLNFGAQIEWTKESGLMKTVSAKPKSECNTYLCMLDPSSPHCH